MPGDHQGLLQGRQSGSLITLQYKPSTLMEMNRKWKLIIFALFVLGIFIGALLQSQYSPEVVTPETVRTPDTPPPPPVVASQP